MNLRQLQSHIGEYVERAQETVTLALESFGDPVIDAAETGRDKLYEYLHGKPDLIIFGECHIAQAHVREQVRSILRHEPEIVLSEAWTDSEPENYPILKASKYTTLEEFCDLSEVSIAELEITQSTLNEWRRRVIQEHQKTYDEMRKRQQIDPARLKKHSQKSLKKKLDALPKTIEELLKTPAYALQADIFYKFLDHLEDRSKTNPALINMKRIIFRQRNIARLETPKSDPTPLYRAIGQVGAKLGGCDMSTEIPVYKAKFEGDDPDSIQKRRQERNEFLEMLNQTIEVINGARERNMGNVMTKWALDPSIKKPVIAIVGRVHIQETSIIHPILRAKGVHYRTISQPFTDHDSFEAHSYPFFIVD